jgi:hypothetical protein
MNRRAGTRKPSAAAHRSPRMLCGWGCGTELTTSQMRVHFNGMPGTAKTLKAVRPAASSKGVRDTAPTSARTEGRRPKAGIAVKNPCSNFEKGDIPARGAFRIANLYMLQVLHSPESGDKPLTHFAPDQPKGPWS